jgi:hypothetical protein
LAADTDFQLALFQVLPSKSPVMSTFMNTSGPAGALNLFKNSRTVSQQCHYKFYQEQNKNKKSVADVLPIQSESLGSMDFFKNMSN